MSVSILIATFGDEAWSELAWSRAYPSAIEQGAAEVLVRHEPDGTVASARNALAGMAEGEWLCFLDADDELCPGYLVAMEKVAPELEPWVESPFGPGRDSILAPAVSYGGSRPGIPNLGGWPGVNECVIGTLVPRRVFLQLGGFRELPSLEDWDLWLRCVKAGARIVHVPDAVYCAHVTPNSRNSDQSVYAQLREEHAEVWAR